MKERSGNVLVTGNLGYIGSVLVPALMDRGFTVTGFDTCFYGEQCALYDEPALPFAQIIKDIRDVSADDLAGADYVVHLAALSNDPLGDLAPGVTEDINYHGTMRLARSAREAGVKRFVYASSQSMYGISDTSGEVDEDKSPKNPVTAYAKTKWAAEQDLMAINSPEFTVTAFRPSTVFGASRKLRTDIVFNNLVSSGYVSGRIIIKSDGTPWRPVIHVRDVCDAFIAGIIAPKEVVAGQAFNVGAPGGNYTVADLAESAQRCVPGSELVFTNEHGSDSRTYRVKFDKIFNVLHDYFKPSWDLDRGGAELVALFKKTGLNEEDFKGRKYVRLIHLKSLIEEGRLSRDLRWIGN